MNKELQAIKDAWDKHTGKGRDDHARDLADAYVAAHPEQFVEYEGLSIEDCVNAVTIFRNAGLTESQWKAETWLLHHFEPQNIGGQAQATVRIPRRTE